MRQQDLESTIEEIQATIKHHAKRLRKSEAQTSRTLIDPLLEALGWNISSPASVRVEFPTGGGTADYALLDSDGVPLVIVEAKRLDTPLEEAAAQAFGYCAHEAYKHFAATDGNRWNVYDYERPGPLHEKRILSVDIRNDKKGTVDLSTLLWRSPLLAPSVRQAERKAQSERERVEAAQKVKRDQERSKQTRRHRATELNHGGRSIEAISQAAERRLRKRTGR